MNDNQSEMTANGILFDFFIVEAVKIQSISNKKIESTNYITKIKHKKPIANRLTPKQFFVIFCRLNVNKPHVAGVITPAVLVIKTEIKSFSKGNEYINV